MNRVVLASIGTVTWVSTNFVTTEEMEFFFGCQYRIVHKSYTWMW